MIQLQIEKLPEGMYLATSDDVQGQVAQAAPFRRRSRLRATWPRR
jgi:hypothetical protein